jgi:hypothetical protein
VWTGGTSAGSVTIGTVPKAVISMPVEVSGSSGIVLNGTVNAHVPSGVDMKCNFGASGPGIKSALTTSVAQGTGHTVTVPVAAWLALNTGAWTVTIKCWADAAVAVSQSQITAVLAKS